jgi:hypothetical protein
MKKTALKYSIIRIRMKISFMAFKEKITVQEHIFKKILESHTDLIN